MSVYKQLPSDKFVQLYSIIHKCIQTGQLSKGMYQELELIKKAAEEKNIKIIELHID
ncbi:hypothetical protein GLW20_03950 [Virgibacillus halodenitrificans]|nr:hypothetical protein [Virgibacillus halodenitrificans]